MDIEGFEEDDDGKPKTPAPVRKTGLLEGYVADMRSPHENVPTSHQVHLFMQVTI